MLRETWTLRKSFAIHGKENGRINPITTFITQLAIEDGRFIQKVGWNTAIINKTSKAGQCGHRLQRAVVGVPPHRQFTQCDGHSGQNSYPTCSYFGAGTAVCGK